MDHLSHPLPGQSQTAHLQPHLHRRSRPATLGMQGRLPRRIQRRRSPHPAPSDLRGHLCRLVDRRNGDRRNANRGNASRRDATVGSNPAAAQHATAIPSSAAGGNFAPARNLAPSGNLAPERDSPHSLASAPLDPQVSPTLPRPPKPHLRPSLSLVNSGKAPQCRRYRECLQPRGCVQPRECPQPRGRAALQRRVSYPDLIWALAPVAARLVSGHRFSDAAAPNSIAPSGAEFPPPIGAQLRKTQPLQPLPHICERTMNRTCGKQFHHPAPSPSLLEIQPMVFLS